MSIISTAKMRVLWEPYFKKGYTGRITFLGREGVKYYAFTLDAWRAMESALTATGYGPASIVSTYYPKYIAGTTQWSLHSFSGVALDIDPAKNPYRKGVRFSWSHTAFTPAQVAAVKAIRTMNGKQVWRWGGDSFGTYSHDYMHWQLNVSPDDIATGIDPSTVLGEGIETPTEDFDMSIKRGDSGPEVKWWQEALLKRDADCLPKYGADADFGGETETAVKAAQVALGLTETGVIDLTTGSALLAATVSGAPGPQGPRGEKGPTGPVGPRGPRGRDAVIEVTYP